jgi:uncharacterized protein YutE (UPF0331/DUF86 family)
MVPSTRDKLEQLRQEIEFLEEKKNSVERPEKLTRREPGYAIQKSLEVAIESALDISRQLLSEHAISQPDENRRVFERLAENNLISEEQLSTYKDMASFRNILVHEYIKVDPEEIFRILKNVDDLGTLAGELANAIQQTD